MGCSHAVACPLFPLLSASLRGWRDYYCDTDDRWHDCARYKLSLTGRPIPITLLPNGRDAQHLARAAASAGVATAEPVRKSPPEPERPRERARAYPPQPERSFERPPQPEPRFEREPVRAPRRVPPPRDDSFAEDVTPWFGNPQIRQEQIRQPEPPAPAPAPRPRKNTPPSQPKRRWWSRLADWMKEPA